MYIHAGNKAFTRGERRKKGGGERDTRENAERKQDARLSIEIALRYISVCRRTILQRERRQEIPRLILELRRFYRLISDGCARFRFSGGLREDRRKG